MIGYSLDPTARNARDYVNRLQQQAQAQQQAQYNQQLALAKAPYEAQMAMQKQEQEARMALAQQLGLVGGGSTPATSFSYNPQTMATSVGTEGTGVNAMSPSQQINQSLYDIALNRYKTEAERAKQSGVSDLYKRGVGGGSTEAAYLQGAQKDYTQGVQDLTTQLAKQQYQDWLQNQQLAMSQQQQKLNVLNSLV